MSGAMIELIRPILDKSFFYEAYHVLIGARYRSAILVTDYIRPKKTDRILDIGCGPGNMLPFLPDCDYVGVDSNEEYIAAARRRYGHRGRFICERVSHHDVNQLDSFDIVLALGLVHHLNDSEARDLFRVAFVALRAGGRLITNDGCYTSSQSALERYLLSRDRGRFVRNQEQYVELAHSCFAYVNPHLRRDVLRIPYTHLILECTR
jgi:cyclopropane fatty-acyl-phospholipid synthase-like methyltransferase